MKEGIRDSVERHIIYFMAGFFVTVSSVIFLTFLYILMIAPIALFGYYHILIVTFFILAMYYIGRKIMNEVN